ncbi:TnsD family Tn7-like transposition protein [Hydrocarboniphaga effusa]|jgi:hypothetical protein|uniref:TnsD family Tn7-like transposition protein n=1 Tax=Hydrocarboniphaga effusa TaxID=243629 RepID=UPI0031379064
MPLFESALKATGVSRFDWILPSGQLGGPASGHISDSTLKSWRSLAAMTVGIISAEEGHGWLPIGRLQKVLLRELSDRGWLTSSGQLRTKLMAPAFVEYAKSFSGLLEMAALPSATGDAETQLGRLLRPMRTGTHPLRYITLIDWLFPDAAAFRSVVAETDLEEPVSREVVPMVPHRVRRIETHARDELVRRIRDGQSPTAAAREIRVDIATARAWAAQAGIATERRPSVLKPNCCCLCGIDQLRMLLRGRA